MSWYDDYKKRRASQEADEFVKKFKREMERHLSEDKREYGHSPLPWDIPDTPVVIDENFPSRIVYSTPHGDVVAIDSGWQRWLDHG